MEGGCAGLLESRGVQRTRQPAKTDPTQPTELCRFLKVDGLVWVMKFFFLQWVGLGSGHEIYKST